VTGRPRMKRQAFSRMMSPLPQEITIWTLRLRQLSARTQSDYWQLHHTCSPSGAPASASLGADVKVTLTPPCMFCMENR
jgi:hypothetical protein